MEVTKHRYQLLADALKISVKELERKIDVSETRLSAAISRNSKIKSEIVDKILTAYPEVNKTWLETGEGDMFTNKESDISSQLDKARNKLNSGHGEPIPEGVMGKVSRFLRKYNPSLGSWLEAKLINQETITPSDQALAIQAMQDIRKDQQEIDELLKSMKEDVGNMLKENEKSNDSKP